METNKLTIAEILKEKPKGTKLYSPLCGDCWLVNADYKGDEFGKNFPIVVSRDKDDGVKALQTISFTAQGTLFENVGECTLFPSKEMRDWDKFAWKRGDVLKSDNSEKIIFTRFDDDTEYQTFTGVHNDCHTIIYSAATGCKTKFYKKVSFEEAKEYIKYLEVELCGKFNPKTLEIKEQYEFKDGDMVYVETKDDYKIIAIFQRFSTEKRPVVYAELFLDEKKVRLTDSPKDYYILCDWEEITEIRLATDEEKELFLSKLANIGKKWNPETKQIEDLPQKYEFKPFDKVLVRDDDDKHWFPALYSPYGDKDKGTEIRPQYRTIYIPSEQFWTQCIPYEGNEHLLGTTDSPSK